MVQRAERILHQQLADSPVGMVDRDSCCLRLLAAAPEQFFAPRMPFKWQPAPQASERTVEGMWV